MNLPDNKPLAYSINEAVAAARIGRTFLYAAIKKGELPVVKLGRSTRVLHADLLAFLESKKAA